MGGCPEGVDKCVALKSMVEKNMQTLFKHWIANNPPKRSAVYELKLEKTNRLSFDRVYDHQIAGLRQAKKKGMYHKIADQPAAWVGGKRVHFGGKKPFDSLFLKGIEAYVVVCFYKPNHIKRAIFIDVDKFVELKESSERKSMTEEMAESIATRVAEL